MNASSSSRVGTRPLAIGSGARRGFLGLGFGLLLGRCLLLGRRLLCRRLVAGVVGGDRRRLLRARRLGLLAAALGGALGQQRHRLVDRQLLGLEVARHRGVDAGVLHVHAVAAIIELDRRLVVGVVADDAD